jgi:hypothetical protein
MARRASIFKLHAYKLFRAGVPLREIAEKVGCSRSLVYRWSKLEQWTSSLQSPLARIESAAQKIQSGDETAGLTEVLRSKIPDRLAELEAVCRRGNVAAIGLWLRLGLTPPRAATAEPTEAQVPSPVLINLSPSKTKTTVVDAEPVVQLINLPDANDESAPAQNSNGVAAESHPLANPHVAAS